MASWLSPQHLQDAARVLRGVALVLAKAAVESAQNRAVIGQAQAAVKSAAELVAAQAQFARQAAAAAAPAPAAAAGVAGGANPLTCYLYPETVRLLQLSSSSSSSSSSSWHPSAAWATREVAAEPQQQHQAQSWQQAERITEPQQNQQHQHQQKVVSRQQQPLQHDAAASSTVAREGAAVQAAGEAPAAVGAAEQQLRQPQQHAFAAATSSSEQQQQSPLQSVAVDSHQQHQQQQQPHERIDTWISGHESVTTEAEALKPATAALLAAAPGTPAAAAAGPDDQQQQQQPRKAMRERRVPSTQFGRALGFAGMGASLLLGSLSDSFTKAIGGSSSDSSSGGSGSVGSGGGAGVYSAFITESNAERLAAALCRMRGAALKIGQMLSIQDESVLPPQIQSALERVRAGADVMPRWQLEKQLVSQLGPDWRSQLADFDWTPRAAASIGQVHAATLHDGRQVAMKIQYPGVARSIESDVDNLMRLISVANILPPGLFVENAVKVAKRELALECDYSYEAAAQGRFKQLVADDPQLSQVFHVPAVIPQLSSRQVLTTEWVNGVTIDKVAELDQGVRDAVGTWLLRLTLRELYDWRLMQTDPNWGNFLYDGAAGRLNLIDFGAAKEFPRSFVDTYLAMVHACAERQRQAVIDSSIALGFLTGDESAVMLDAHTEAGFVVGLPFATEGLYDFGAHSGMTPRVAELGSVMLKHRLTPPPEESYSLHRKLSGAFLACMKLRARVPCRQLFMDTYHTHNPGASSSSSPSGAAAAGDSQQSDDEQQQQLARSAAA